MNKDNLNINFKSYSDIFAKEPFSKREAWNWLVDIIIKKANQTSEIKSSLRFLAQEWQWSKTKVARFLKALTKAKLIEIETNYSLTAIRLIQADNLKITSLDSSNINQNQVGTEIRTENGTVKAQETQAAEENTRTEIKTLSGTETQKNDFTITKTNLLGQKRDSFGTENATPQAKTKYGLQTTGETEIGTIPGQARDTNDFSKTQKEEKKKRSKKRKEEIYSKEKYSLKGIQKERYEQNMLKNSDCSIEIESSANSIQAFGNCKTKTQLNRNTRKTTDQVEIQDIALWAADNIPNLVNLEWELSKFQDYYRATFKKQPKDGIAAFRNWLRNSIEFKKLNIGGHLNEGYNRDQTNQFKETTGIERFLAAGARAIAEFEKC